MSSLTGQDSAETQPKIPVNPGTDAGKATATHLIHPQQQPSHLLALIARPLTSLHIAKNMYRAKVRSRMRKALMEERRREIKVCLIV
ncbi:hypothetical protein BKA66DRAFT_261922 [Pyrenochaeta sp. MPI-SDFR-AT-0127]|nr:hypothetical protein BKA66DRAFT_261922 [Pyrenochaeta sp. MPI-SDFR-AT-0127]